LWARRRRRFGPCIGRTLVDGSAHAHRRPRRARALIGGSGSGPGVVGRSSAAADSSRIIDVAKSSHARRRFRRWRGRALVGSGEELARSIAAAGPPLERSGAGGRGRTARVLRPLPAGRPSVVVVSVLLTESWPQGVPWRCHQRLQWWRCFLLHYDSTLSILVLQVCSLAFVLSIPWS
jgi:hypothetical protein